MRTLASPGVLDSLTARFRGLTAAQSARWGSMSAHQMTLHICDATEATLGRRPFAAKARSPNPMRKIVLLYILPRFPRGVRSGAEPASRTVDATTYNTDVARAAGLLAELAAAPADTLAARHPILGAMTRDQWLRWAWMHTDHHLRQFGA
ncbi:MAG TPA: DUF1569 domain-containing protein [Gemmatimonadaceae bacterium]|nr:DUF1569 domain-containing protein [Gemmatimonadaceae bacterium]